MDATLVFVYGSLLRGFRNHRCLDGAEFVGKGQTESESFRMVSLGAFPGVLPATAGTTAAKICGELYRVNEAVLRRLDRLEGHPDFYKRTPVSVVVEGTRYDAAIYILQRSGRAAITPEVPDGDWRRFAVSQGIEEE